MASEHLVDVTYRGLELGRGLRLSHVGSRSAYLACDAPLPVGSELLLAVADGPRIAVRVLRVQEHPAVLPPGMRVGVIGLEEEAQAWWEARVTGPDPVIPEPARMHEIDDRSRGEAGLADAATGADAPAGAPAGEGSAGAAAPIDDVVDEPESFDDQMVAGADEVDGTEPVESDGGAEEDSGAGDGAARRRGRSTEVMSAVEIEEMLQSGADEPGTAADDASLASKGKGKKRRRRARNRR
jgi:hypothetical protein